MQEVSNILDFMPKPQRGKQNGSNIEPHQLSRQPSSSKQAEERGKEASDSDDQDDDPDTLRLERGSKKQKTRKLQTFVFSATLTMPESLRKRLRRGISHA